MIKLFNYQREIIDSNETKILMNWARCNGKTWTIANYIKEKKPREVLWANFISPAKMNSLQDKFSELLHMDEEFKNSLESFKMSSNEIFFKFKDGKITQIKILREYELTEWLRNGRKKRFVDLIIFDECHPFETGYDSNKIICSITENNYDKHLQQKFPNYFISEADYKIALEKNLINKEIITRLKEDNEENFLKEFAILDSLYGSDSIDLEFFKTKAIRELIYEYERIPNANNTVMTRKNIIEMIKDLNQL